VYDDYAHNPEKLHAMLTTFQDRHEKGVAVLWRPHGYGPLRKMADDLADMFNGVLRPQDALVLLPVYDAGGTADRSVNSDSLAGKVKGSRFVETPEEAVELLKALAPAVGAIVTAGARDPGLPVMARRLAGKE
jgi:UDP-N-acetylmuramate--alanine ligase